MTTGSIADRYRMITLLVLFLSLQGKAQTATTSPGKKLTTADFKGIPDAGSDHLARTYVKISYAYYNPKNCTVPGKVKLSVEADAVVTDKSWMKVNTARRYGQLDALLSHEQGHYDIFRIFAAQLQRTLSKTCFNKDKYNVQIDSVYRSMNRFYDSLQLTYDAETSYMRNNAMQEKWKQKIAGMMEK